MCANLVANYKKRLTSVIANMGFQYWCQGQRTERPQTSQPSAPLGVTVTALPHASLTVEPHWSPIYTGETVSLRCGLSGGYTDWQYHWYKDGKRIEDAQPAGHTVTGDKLSITAVSVSDGGKYHCEGQRADRPLSSQRSDPVSLSVSGVRPRPFLTVSPLGQIFEGDSVTLRCEVTARPTATVSVSPKRPWYPGETLTLRCQISGSLSG
ncbi:leukocyte immunoglobulin-like receptor subfamily A member 3 [Amia ocellicauda]|uniref:leukocyte immunoglobulin-like receptor subfamily A member 3 n=1 Tax=Amia ocellicauda TaxID=2972642 RepID=UPI003463BE7B